MAVRQRQIIKSKDSTNLSMEFLVTVIKLALGHDNGDTGQHGFLRGEIFCRVTVGGGGSPRSSRGFWFIPSIGVAGGFIFEQGGREGKGAPGGQKWSPSLPVMLEGSLLAIVVRDLPRPNCDLGRSGW
jgi:hypothetical protein